MSREHVYNFSPGPSVLPESVLLRAQRELPDFAGSGMSVMEMSHRSKIFQAIFDEAKAKFKKALAVPDTHEVLFLQGGGTLQFAMVPMNLLEGASADYAVTGNFSGKAAKEAAKYGSVRLAAEQGKLSERHARALLALDSEAEQLALIERIVKEGWSVRQAEGYVEKSAPRPRPLRVLRLTRDCRLFLNGLSTLLDQLRQAGMGAEMDTEKREDGLVVTIRVRTGG